MCRSPRQKREGEWYLLAGLAGRVLGSFRGLAELDDLFQVAVGDLRRRQHQLGALGGRLVALQQRRRHLVLLALLQPVLVLLALLVLLLRAQLAWQSQATIKSSRISR